MTGEFLLKVLDKEGNEFVKTVTLVEENGLGLILEFGGWLSRYRLLDLTMHYPYDRDLYIDTSGRIMMNHEEGLDSCIPKEAMNRLLEELALLYVKTKGWESFRCNSSGCGSIGLCPGCKKEARSRIKEWQSTTILLGQVSEGIDTFEKTGDRSKLDAVMEPFEEGEEWKR